MWTTEYTLTTDASPEALWQLLSDIDGWGAWNDGIETIALDGPLAIGVTFQMKPPGEDVLTSTVAELEQNRLLTDVTDMGELVIRVEHRLEPLAGGGTSITLSRAGQRSGRHPRRRSRDGDLGGLPAGHRGPGCGGRC